MSVRRHREQGQALIEFALVMVVLLTTLMGIFDLGRALYFYNVAANVAREGARYAASIEGQSKTEAQIASRAVSYAPGMEGSLAVSVSPQTASDRKNGSPLTVTVQLAFEPITPLIPGPLNLRSLAVVYAE